MTEETSQWMAVMLVNLRGSSSGLTSTSMRSI